MENALKNQREILDKLGIEELNEMQLETHAAIHSSEEIVLLSPTGTGKTLAFLLPLFELLDSNETEVQALILVPSRELALQIEQVSRNIGAGYKCTAVYGGRTGAKDKMDLKHRPAVLIGTPGRVADHMRRNSFPSHQIRFLVLDEFDKSLEVGFEKEMKEILRALPGLGKKILTSATERIEIPGFVGLRSPKRLDFIKEEQSQLQVKRVIATSRDKLETLVDLLGQLGEQPGIIFCNFKDSIHFVSDFLIDKGISHGTFHGGMEQLDREQSLVKFRNGTTRVLIATDLAARGIDIPELGYIIHYQLPAKEHEFIHRNGRTARMKSEGTAYILLSNLEGAYDYVPAAETEEIRPGISIPPTSWTTIYIKGGRKDKISKGDIAGLFFKQGGLEKGELGVIELKQDCAYVAVTSAKADHIISTLNNSRLKKKKVRISRVEEW